MLRENAAIHGADRRRSPPREGPALLQGIVICGKCGLRMTVRYHQSRGTLLPIYVCQRDGIQRGQPICQHISGASLDVAVGSLVLEAVSPLALEITLAVEHELHARLEEADAIRRTELDHIGAFIGAIIGARWGRR